MMGKEDDVDWDGIFRKEIYPILGIEYDDVKDANSAEKYAAEQRRIYYTSKILGTPPIDKWVKLREEICKILTTAPKYNLFLGGRGKGKYMKKIRITLKEFFESKDTLAIHCDTEEEANVLLKAFDNMGKKWFGGYGYLDHNHWEIYKGDTVYYNSREYSSIEFAKKKGYPIYEFEDVDLESKEEIIMKKKKTLSEFFESKEKLYIHCDTEEKANTLLKAFDKMGKKWANGDSYLGNNYWFFREKDTSYSNDGRCYSIEYAKDKDCTIYEFDEVDLQIKDEFTWEEYVLPSKKEIDLKLAKIEEENKMGEFKVKDNRLKGIYANKGKKIVVIKWDDDTITKAKCDNKDEFDLYTGVALAMVKKVFGTNSHYKKFVDKNVKWEKSKEKKPTKKYDNDMQNPEKKTKS